MTNAMTKTVQIANPGIDTYVVSNLSPGTWYFSIRAYTSANVESAASGGEQSHRLNDDMGRRSGGAEVKVQGRVQDVFVIQVPRKDYG